VNALPLTDEDRAILALESPTVAGHTCKVIVVAPPAPSTDHLRAAIEKRLDEAPALRRRLGDSEAEPAWVPDEGFDIAQHVVGRPQPQPLDRASLCEEVALLFAQRLDRDRPLWRIDVLPMQDGGAALVWRIHHALADGTAAMRYARILLWEERDPAGTSTTAHSTHQEADDVRRRAHLAAFMGRELARSRERSPFDGRIGTRRHVAFARAPLGALHDAAKRIDGATLNDAVLTVVAGGLRHWVQEHHGRLGDVRVKVPVSLHKEGDDAGNRDSFFSLGLPLNEPDPATRLREVHAATAVRKAEHDAEALDQLTRRLAALSPGLERFCARCERNPRRFAVNVSNVPGPRGPVSVLDVPVRSVHSIAEIGERHALRVAVVSLAGALYFGLLADPAIVDDLETMAEGVEAEAAALVAAG
jgi:Wax ester synthase/diacylglycerol acyltransferase catalytic domain/WS/DGAT C-terminal domain